MPFSGRTQSQSSPLPDLLSTARTEHRDLLIYLHAAWCSSCREFEKFILPSRTVGDSLKSFIFIQASLDESALGVELARKYGITTAPVYLVLSPLGELLHCHIGIGADTAYFLRMLAGFRQNGRISGFSADFSVRYPAFYTQFFPSFKTVADSQVVSKYLRTRKDLESEECFNILGTQVIGKKYRSYFLSHSRSYGEKYGPLYFDRVEHLYLSQIRSIIREKDIAAYMMLQDALYVVDSLQGNNFEWLKQFRYIQFLGKSGVDWAKYIQQISLWEQRYGNSHIRNFCDDVYAYCREPGVCYAMAEYLKLDLSSSRELNDDIYFKYAVLLRRAGHEDEAAQALEKAIDLAPGQEKKTLVRQEWDNSR